MEYQSAHCKDNSDKLITYAMEKEAYFSPSNFAIPSSNRYQKKAKYTVEKPVPNSKTEVYKKSFNIDDDFEFEWNYTLLNDNFTTKSTSIALLNLVITVLTLF